MFTTVRKLLQDESGATAIEYGLIAAVVGAGLVAGLPTLITALDTLWGNISAGLGIAGADIATGGQ